MYLKEVRGGVFSLLSIAENAVHGIVLLEGKVVSITAKTAVRNDIG